MMDASGYIALVEELQDALLCRASLQARRFPQVVTPGVVSETHRRLLFDHGRRAAWDFLVELYSSQTTIVRPDEHDERAAMRLIDKYADVRLTFCDALTSAIMLRLGAKRVFTYDRSHFWAVGLIAIPPLDL